MLRITGGEFRGRFIEAPKGVATRPTQSRLRQAMFNSIQAEVPDATVLDLFAGSGALGFEALSRGAAKAAFVEDARGALRLIEKNARELGVEDRIDIVSEPLPRAWKRVEPLGPFSVVFADPPYAEGWEEKLLRDIPWNAVLSENGLFLLEWGLQKSRISELPGNCGPLVKIREKIYGESVLSTFVKRAP